MTEKDLKKLRRPKLLEMLLAQTKENEKLRAEKAALEKQLEQLRQDKLVRMERCGSIAEASLALNGVFEAAQAACDQYIASIEEKVSQTAEECAAKERKTEQNCRRMVTDAEERSQMYWNQVAARIDSVLDQSQGLRALLSDNYQRTQESEKNQS